MSGRPAPGPTLAAVNDEYLWITCPECGARAGLLSPPPAADEIPPGSVLSYRCPDCMERFDFLFGDEPVTD